MASRRYAVTEAGVEQTIQSRLARNLELREIDAGSGAANDNGQNAACGLRVIAIDGKRPGVSTLPQDQLPGIYDRNPDRCRTGPYFLQHSGIIELSGRSGKEVAEDGVVHQDEHTAGL